MSTLVFLLIAGLAVWGVLSTVLRLEGDGYGRPEIRDRNRHAENLPTRPVCAGGPARVIRDAALDRAHYDRVSAGSGPARRAGT